MGEPLWRLSGVRLGGNSPARLQDISLEIQEGVTAVLGCSGAGKTSLLNLLVGFEAPDGGGISAALRTQGHSLPLFWAPQNGGLWPHLTVHRHLEAVLPKGAGESAVAEMLASFDMADKAGSYPDELSGGERSRVSVARALLTNAAVLVIDEPLASVDVARADRFWRVIRERAAASGASLVYSTHSPRMVIGEAERVICLKEGRLLYAGEVDGLYRRPPNPEAAECLGEANWVLPKESRLWLQRDEAEPRCYRPEQIAIEPEADGPAIVQSSSFKGALAEVVLKHKEDGAIRRFWHRPSSGRLRPGDRVVLKLLLSLVLFVLAACSRQSEPALSVSQVRTWPMVPEKTRIPAPRAMSMGRNGELLVLDTAARVLVYDKAGTLLRQWKMPETTAGNPEGSCVFRDGRIAVADTHYHRIVFFDEQGRVLKMLGREGRGPGEFIYPVTIVQDDQENWYVCEYGSNDRIQKFSKGDDFILAFGTFGTGPGQFQRPSGMVWRAGKLYVADAINNRIQVFSDSGQFIRVLGSPEKPLSLGLPYALQLGPDDALYVVEYAAGRVSRVSLDGELLGRYGRTGGGTGEFATPWGISVDSRGRIRVADTGNRRIVELIP